MNKRYSRQLILPQVGELGQKKLLKAKVLLIGVGGLGSAVLPYLVAAGIGEVGIVDADKVELSNLQRQVIYTLNSVGNSKVLEAKKSAEALNSDCKITTYDTFFSVENALQLVEKYDVIVDGTDNVATKYLINDACVVQNKPLVYGSVYRFEGQISVFNYKKGPSYRCLYPDESQKINSCVEAGILGASVALIGILQANEVFKIILGLQKVLTEELLIYNLLTNTQEKFFLDKKDFLIQNKEQFLNKYLLADSKIISNSATEALSHFNDNNVQFLDVRNLGEKPEIKHVNCLQIPLSDLESKLIILDESKDIFIFCQSGIRSKVAAELLLKNNYKKIKIIEGGALALQPLLNTIETFNL